MICAIRFRRDTLYHGTDLGTSHYLVDGHLIATDQEDAYTKAVLGQDKFLAHYFKTHPGLTPGKYPEQDLSGPQPIPYLILVT